MLPNTNFYYYFLLLQKINRNSVLFNEAIVFLGLILKEKKAFVTTISKNLSYWQFVELRYMSAFTITIIVDLESTNIVLITINIKYSRCPLLVTLSHRSNFTNAFG